MAEEVAERKLHALLSHCIVLAASVRRGLRSRARASSSARLLAHRVGRRSGGGRRSVGLRPLGPHFSAGTRETADFPATRKWYGYHYSGTDTTFDSQS
eukprot:7379921-Prymnesium_polylepis.1